MSRARRIRWGGGKKAPKGERKRTGSNGKKKAPGRILCHDPTLTQVIRSMTAEKLGGTNSIPRLNLRAMDSEKGLVLKLF